MEKQQLQRSFPMNSDEKGSLIFVLVIDISVLIFAFWWLADGLMQVVQENVATWGDVRATLFAYVVLLFASYFLFCNTRFLLAKYVILQDGIYVTSFKKKYLYKWTDIEDVCVYNLDLGRNNFHRVLRCTKDSSLDRTKFAKRKSILFRQSWPWWQDMQFAVFHMKTIAILPFTEENYKLITQHYPNIRTYPADAPRN